MTGRENTRLNIEIVEGVCAGTDFPSTTYVVTSHEIHPVACNHGGH
jgi:hypothetical protein